MPESLITEVVDNVEGHGASVRPIEEAGLGKPIIDGPKRVVAGSQDDKIENEDDTQCG